MLYSQKTVENLGAILGVWAHPDDECWASAGLMKIACNNGQRIGVITATNGGAGETADEVKWPKNSLAEIRVEELEKCLCNFGIVDQFLLGFQDGKLVFSDEAVAVNEIIRIINLFNPDTIVTFEPNGITGHDDHKAISLWTDKAVKKIDKNITVLHAIESKEKFELAGQKLDDKYNIFFNVEEPQVIPESDADILLKLDDDILDCKMNCLKAHGSQTSQMLSDASGREALKLFASTECFLKANK